ncbi:MAG: 50S ribosomal protein L4 [Candidatus Omnitrophota bacterium]|jgi:large subunit ribosomal protein L4
METITLPIYNAQGKEVDSIKLNTSVFDGIINSEAIYQAVTAYRANQRKGLAATKTRGEVSGGGKKPWKQKGTGRARVGSTRSPLWRHGGVVFGPHPRDFSYTLPDKIKNVALKSSLNAKVKENNLIVLDEFKLENSKTKEAMKLFTNLKINSSKDKKSSRVLFLLDKSTGDEKLALRNIDFLKFTLATDTNVYEVLAHKKLVITKDGLTQLTNRLKK